MSDDLIELEEAEGITIDTWLARPFISPERREELISASLLLVPVENFRDSGQDALAPETEPLIYFLEENAPEEVKADVAIDRDKYLEYGLHGILIDFGIAVCTLLVAPIVVNLISEYLKQKYLDTNKDAEVRLELHVDHGDGRSAKISYKGPAKAFNETVAPLVQNRPKLPPVDPHLGSNIDFRA